MSQSGECVLKVSEVLDALMSFIRSFHWHVQNAMIPCRSQELLPFLSVMYFFLPPFSTDYSSILSHFILPSVSWSTSQSHCSQVHIYSRTSIYRFSRGWRKQTMNAGKRLIRETTFFNKKSRTLSFAS